MTRVPPGLPMRTRLRFLVAAAAFVFLSAAAAAQGENTNPAEQDQHDHAGHDMSGHDHDVLDDNHVWLLAADGNAFVGYNYQQRRFADFPVWESQNWFGVTAEHPLGSGRLSIDGMVSLEPFTMHAVGSPQLFQTGESYQRVPLVNYQHPHDLVMNLGATWRVQRGRARYFAGVD